jgi:hypothetical protein
MKHRLWKKLNREARGYAHIQTSEHGGYIVFYGDSDYRSWKHFTRFNDAKLECDYYRRLYILHRITEIKRAKFKSDIVY